MEDYWKEYDGLQDAKHKILKRYLGGWYPKLTSNKRRVFYVDSHAGRGRHVSGQVGSPLIAIDTLLNHRNKKQILKDSEINFLFLENEQNHCDHLNSEIDKLETLPKNIKTYVVCNDFHNELTDALDRVDEDKMGLAPTFAFIDPYGFTLPLSLINRILNYNSCEVFINFMFRYVDMAINNQSQGLGKTLDKLFGTEKWQEYSKNKIKDVRERRSSIIDLYASQLNAKYVTSVKMLGNNNAIKYVLFHGTNHVKGWNLMKESIWAAIPNGSFQAFEKNSPGQITLFSDEPDLRLFEQAIIKKLSERPYHVKELHDWIVQDRIVYLNTHLHACLKNLRDKNIIERYKGRAGATKNQLICLRDNV